MNREIDGQEILIDKAHEYLLDQWPWQLDQSGYVYMPHVAPVPHRDPIYDSKGRIRLCERQASPGRKAFYLHRLIMAEPQGRRVCFRNKNKLDLRRSNLYVKEEDEKPFKKLKSKKYTGVYHLTKGDWIAVVYDILKNNIKRPRVIGHYETEFKAHMARKNYKGE